MADDCPAGAPLWMVTFADLMALLLTLFVLMLTFSEMNVIKYKALAGALRDAFGSSREQVLSGMIEMDGALKRKAASEVDPTRSEEHEIVQVAEEDDPDSDEDKPHVEVDLPDAPDEKVKEEARARREAEAKALAGALQDVINKEIAGSGISVERSGGEVVIRFPSNIAFASGFADVNGEFADLVSKLIPVLTTTKGSIFVSGHTDNIPISGNRFGSNWDLSASRATAVVHEILHQESLDPARITVQGYGDSRPLVDNDTAENRAKNRRVEISIVAD